MDSKEKTIVTSATQTEVQDTSKDAIVGYKVFLSKDKRLKFETFGTEKELVNLLGINDFANKQIEKIYNEKCLTGDRLVHEVGLTLQSFGNQQNIMFTEIAKALQVLSTKLEVVLNHNKDGLDTTLE